MPLLYKSLAILFVASLCGAVPSWYLKQRRKFIRDEESRRLGTQLVLSDKEELVNNLLMPLKFKHFHDSVYKDIPYLAAGHFAEVRHQIEASTIFKVIQKMPKGAVLHVHNHAMVQLPWIIKTLTYLPNLYTKDNGPDPREYQFSDTNPGEGWHLVSGLRAAAADKEAFDQMLEEELSLFRSNEPAPSGDVAWERLDGYFKSMGGFWEDHKANEMYFKQALKEFYNDGVQYIEIRGRPEESFVELMIRLVEDFQQDHPDFLGIKHICAGGRYQSRQDLEKNAEATVGLMKQYPDLVKGFDVVAHEDPLHTQKYYLNQLLEAKEHNFTLPFFFHAGETDWTDAKDMNLVDAVLLNTSRIGHGFALLRHPKVMEEVRNKGIAVELNTISNQVLGLVSDIRNHPGTVFFANDDPVVVSSDDPPCWYASPLSHDFYMAFMALGSVTDDLRLMKQLAINSFRYSAMTENEKKQALAVWETKWNTFIDDIIAEYHLSL